MFVDQPTSSLHPPPISTLRINILPSTMPPLPPLTSEERQWLKRYYGSEFHFLASYGLSIYKDEAREEGRTILKALMSADDEEVEDGNEGNQEGQKEGTKN
ncbi:MAG: hypothetical protein M1820_009463 [Bogoriella megaspora]|nr:MAG: hypothetical protein M1820_009463 [Bogoriella megaspora]